jgi:hypothetical protein
MQVTLLVVGLIVGFALGLGAGWYLWHPSRTGAEGRPERSERRSARYPRSYEPSTPPQHRPTPRPRPVTALHHPNPISTGADDVRPVGPAPSRSSDPTEQPVEVSRSVPAPEIALASSVGAAAAGAEPFDKYEYRPTPRAERPLSIDQPQAADRHLLNDLLETNRRLTADAERRLRREGAPAVEQLDLAERAPGRPPASAPAPNDLIARHRKLEEDSRRMGRRADER